MAGRSKQNQTLAGGGNILRRLEERGTADENRDEAEGEGELGQAHDSSFWRAIPCAPGRGWAALGCIALYIPQMGRKVKRGERKSRSDQRFDFDFKASAGCMGSYTFR